MDVVPEVGALLDTHGVWLADRECGCCGVKKVFAVKFGDRENDRFLACQKCDRITGKG